MNDMHIRNLDLNLLVIFDAVFRHGTVTEAAREIGLTQPAVSHAVRRLRRLYGDQLFMRTKGGLRPTARAREIAPAIQSALKNIGTTLETVFDPASLMRSFRLGLVNYTAFFLLPVLVERLQATAPKVSVTVDHIDGGEAETQVSRNDVDFAIGALGHAGKPGHAGRRCTRTDLFTDQYRFVARADHPKISGRLRVSHLASLPQINIPLFADVQALLSEHGISARYALTTGNLLSVPFIVSTSELLALVPRSVATIFKDYCNLQVLKPPVEVGTYSISLLSNAELEKEDAYAWMKEMVLKASDNVSRMLHLS